VFQSLTSPYFIFSVITIPLSLSVHEFAHAWTADRLGDDTPRRTGRLTLNPIAHLDPIGLLMMFFGPIGWAKPVPLQPWRFRHPRVGLCITALAGPVSNLVLGVLCLLIVRWYPWEVAGGVQDFLYTLVSTAALVNISLFAFNLLPVPPLDGWRIVSSLLPARWASSPNLDLYGSLLLLLLVFIPQLRNFVIGQWVGFLMSAVTHWFGFHLYW
jgi:Zn-dependent protease